MSAYLEKHRFLRGLSLLIRRYFDHHVARDSAALTYYLLFALFPILIFLSNLVGVISFDMNSLIGMLLCNLFNSLGCTTHHVAHGLTLIGV